MARHLTWVLTLALTCVPALAAGERGRPQDGRQDKRGSSREPGASRDQKDAKAPVPVNQPDERERRKWWLYDRTELGITDQQSREINQIFESTLPKLRETRQETERAEEELSRAIKEHKADLATISSLIDRAESWRSQHAKVRVLMLYRIDLLLSADQRSKLQALRARQEAAREAARKDRQQPPPGHRYQP